MSSWYNTYPKPKISIDLIGLPLVLLDNRPPEDTQFGGMKMLIVQEKDRTDHIFKVMVTEQNIAAAVDLYVMKGCFTFRRSMDQRYGEVCEYIPPKKEEKP